MEAFEYLGMGEWLYNVCLCEQTSLNLQDRVQWWVVLNISFWVM